MEELKRIILKELKKQAKEYKNEYNSCSYFSDELLVASGKHEAMLEAIKIVKKLSV